VSVPDETEVKYSNKELSVSISAIVCTYGEECGTATTSVMILY